MKGTLAGPILLLSACASAPTHYHSLISLPAANNGPTQCSTDQVTGAAANTVLLTHLRVPVQVDRMQLAAHRSPTRLTIYETERWATPLSDQIRAVVIGNLHTALPNLTITDDPQLVGKGPTLRLQMDFEDLDARIGQDASLRVRWRIATSDSASVQTGFCTSQQTLQTSDIDSVVLAWSRSIAEVSAALAQSIRSSYQQ